MSVPSESNGRPSAPEDMPGLLSNLPRTRPQRATPRRRAAREAMATATGAADAPPASNGRRSAQQAPATSRKQPAATAAPKAPAKSKAKAPKAKAKPRAHKAPRPRASEAAVAEPVPMQGFESESDRARGPVHPPGGAELVSSAVEIVGELAKVGISTGERLFRDVLSRLPLS